ncbi:MAG: hypothetical protein COB67_10245, partial [SAR324 cluster bacterium]
RAAVESISTLGYKDLYASILSLTEHQDQAVAVAAIHALGVLRVDGAKEKLTTILHKGSWSVDCRATAAEALDGFAEKAELPFLMYALKDEGHLVRLNSLMAIAGNQEEASINVLLAALRGELVEAPPEKMEDSPTAQAEDKEEQVEDLELSKKATGDVAMEGLEEPSVEEKAAAEEEEEPSGPMSTLEAIQMQNEETAKHVPIEDEVEFSEDEQHFLNLAKKNIARGEKLLTGKRIAPHQDIKQFAARLLARKKGVIVVDALIAALQDEAEVVRQAAAESLGLIGAPTAVQPLLDLLGAEETDTKVKIIRALGRIGDQAVVEPLCALLSDPDIQIQVQAMESLRAISLDLWDSTIQTSTEETVVSLLQHELHGVRKAAIELLLYWGDDQVMDLVLDLKMLEEDRLWLDVGPMLKGDYAVVATEKLLASLSDPELEYYYRIAIELLLELYKETESV